MAAAEIVIELVAIQMHGRFIRGLPTRCSRRNAWKRSPRTVLGFALVRAGAASAVPRKYYRRKTSGAQSCASVLAAFLLALRERDALGALALASPTLFASQAREPTPADLWKAVDLAARPVPASGYTRTPVCLRSSRTSQPGEISDLAHPRRARPAAIPKPMSPSLAATKPITVDVHLERVDTAWTVCGYAISGKQILGVKFEESSD